MGQSHNFYNYWYAERIKTRPWGLIHALKFKIYPVCIGMPYMQGFTPLRHLPVFVKESHACTYALTFYAHTLLEWEWPCTYINAMICTQFALLCSRLQVMGWFWDVFGLNMAVGHYMHAVNTNEVCMSIELIVHGLAWLLWQIEIHDAWHLILRTLNSLLNLTDLLCDSLRCLNLQIWRICVHGNDNRINCFVSYTIMHAG